MTQPDKAASRAAEAFLNEYSDGDQSTHDALAEIIAKEYAPMVEAAEGAVLAIEGLADQQAMPDDSYEPRLVKLRAALAQIRGGGR